MFHPGTDISFPSIHPVVEVPNDVPPRNRYFQAPRILPCVQIKLRRFNGSRTAYICGENVFLQIPQKLKCAELCKNYCFDPEMVYSVWQPQLLLQLELHQCSFIKNSIVDPYPLSNPNSFRTYLFIYCDEQLAVKNSNNYLCVHIFGIVFIIFCCCGDVYV